MLEQSRIILTLQYLYANTDAEHTVSSRDIKKMLAEHGLVIPDSRTIDADVDQLIAAGYEIVRTHEVGKAACYRVTERDFDTVELKVLIDAIAASRFLSVDKSKRIISHLAEMAGVTARPYLESELNQVRSIKRAIGGTLYVADSLFKAIMLHKKVMFQMMEYKVPDKTLVPHRDGKLYVVSPFATIWANDRYYLVAYEEERDQIITPRLDHIRKVKILEEDAIPKPKGFDIGYYYSSVYKMYGGPEEEVTIECENSLLGKFIDRFGMDFKCVPVTDHSFQASVKTCTGNTFFGWLCQYGGKMIIKGPQAIVDQFDQHLQNIINAQKA